MTTEPALGAEKFRISSILQMSFHTNGFKFALMGRGGEDPMADTRTRGYIETRFNQ
jgi:hypothetical protein